MRAQLAPPVAWRARDGDSARRASLRVDQRPDSQPEPGVRKDTSSRSTELRPPPLRRQDERGRVGASIGRRGSSCVSRSRGTNAPLHERVGPSAGTVRSRKRVSSPARDCSSETRRALDAIPEVEPQLFARPLPRATPAHRHSQVQLELRSTRHTLDGVYVFSVLRLNKSQPRELSGRSLVPHAPAYAVANGVRAQSSPPNRPRRPWLNPSGRAR